MSPGERRISLLFSVFVLNQRLRSLLVTAMKEAGLTADEYAVYSLLFERRELTPTQMAAEMAMPLTTVLDYLRDLTARGHLRRKRNPQDGRSYLVSLNMAGVRAHRVANAHWEQGRSRLEAALGRDLPVVAEALDKLDHATDAALLSLLSAQRSNTG